MGNFFRKIRYQVFKQNKIGNYITYALGEIILVVIGILIALQINTMNENDKQEQKMVTYLKQFKIDLENDIQTFNNFIRINEMRIRNIDTIIKMAATKTSLTKDEMRRFTTLHESLVYESYFVPEKSTYSQLVASSHGDFFKNETLRAQLFRYYAVNDRNEKNNEVSTQLYMHHHHTEQITNTILISAENFERLGYGAVKRPNIDFASLSLNTPYVSAISRRRGNAVSQNSNYTWIKGLAEELLEAIEKELEKHPSN